MSSKSWMITSGVAPIARANSFCSAISKYKYRHSKSPSATSKQGTSSCRVRFDNSSARACRKAQATYQYEVLPGTAARSWVVLSFCIGGRVRDKSGRANENAKKWSAQARWQRAGGEPYPYRKPFGFSAALCSSALTRICCNMNSLRKSLSSTGTIIPSPPSSEPKTVA